MRVALSERFGDLGLGETDSPLRPVVGPVHLAAGFLPSAVLGCAIRYFPDASPEVLPAHLSDEQILALDVPDLEQNPAFQRLIGVMDSLEERYGRLEGDVNWEGVQNVALNLRGQQLFLDYYENPELARRLLDVVARTLEAMAGYVRRRTGTSSVAVNPIVGAVDPRISLHSNCTVAMISAPIYEAFLLEHDRRLARASGPTGSTTAARTCTRSATSTPGWKGRYSSTSGGGRTWLPAGRPCPRRSSASVCRLFGWPASRRPRWRRMWRRSCAPPVRWTEPPSAVSIWIARHRTTVCVRSSKRPAGIGATAPMPRVGRSGRSFSDQQRPQVHAPAQGGRLVRSVDHRRHVAGELSSESGSRPKATLSIKSCISAGYPLLQSSFRAGNVQPALVLIFSTMYSDSKTAASGA